MTEYEIEIGKLRNLSEEELSALLETVKTDLADAAENQNNSEWHECCFVAAIVVAEEVQRRRNLHLH